MSPDDRFDEVARRFDESDARAEKRHRDLMERVDERYRELFSEYRGGRLSLIERQERSERIFIEAWSEIDQDLQRNNEKMDESFREVRDSIRDMRESIQANTRAVLSVLDRLEPGSA